MLNYVLLFASVVLTVAANLILKKGSFAVENISFSVRGVLEFVILMFKNPYVLSGLSLLGIAFIMWVWLLSRMQLNVMYPIAVSAQLVLLSVVSWLAFREALSTVQIGGIIAIVVGIFLLMKPA